MYYYKLIMLFKLFINHFKIPFNFWDWLTEWLTMLMVMSECWQEVGDGFYHWLSEQGGIVRLQARLMLLFSQNTKTSLSISLYVSPTKENNRLLLIRRCLVKRVIGWPSSLFCLNIYFFSNENLTNSIIYYLFTRILFVNQIWDKK